MKTLSLFTGAMGLDIGLEKYGFHTVVAVENDKHAQATIRLNRPDVTIFPDAMNLPVNEILEKFGPFDAVVGGPPCQSWSYAGKQLGLNDPRGLCIPQFIEIVKIVLPKFVVMENVQGLLTASIDDEPGAVVKSFCSSLANLGYKISVKLANSADYGSPQTRKRVVILAQLNGPAPQLKPTHANEDLFGLPPWLTLKDSISNLPPSAGAKYAPSQLKYLKLLKAGQNWRNLPANLQEEAMGGAFHGEGGRTRYFKRMSWDKPSPTLLCCPTQKSTCLCHPDEDRPLNLKEYAKIQGFPDDWQFCGSVAAQYKQIGNAVPIQLAEAIGRALKDAK